MEEENKCNYKNEVKPSSIHELSIRNIRMAGTPTILIDFSP